ncbi:MAG: glycerol-3-phosphate dehydrogenase [Pseudomonadota bacterium]
MAEQHYDILVVGGGINGTGIARDAAGRGLSVLLCEKDDLASHTSSWSSKLIHGGLRYLEQGDIRLVREALKEREVLMNAAPFLIQPLRFILPHHPGLRPAWLLRLGLGVYDLLARGSHLPKTERVDLIRDPRGFPLSDAFRVGFEYSDCRVDDSRLVVLNAVDAAERGADIRTRTAFLGAERVADGWSVLIRSSGGIPIRVRAKALVNAAGPWVNDTISDIQHIRAQKQLRLVKGSHIITKKLYANDRAYTFQNRDGRVIFTIPYLFGTTLIGTTEETYDGDPTDAAINEGEIAYLCRSVSAYFARPVIPSMVLHHFSGVRPLYDDLSRDDASKVTRDYAFDLNNENGAPILSVYGGKLTTYRKLSENAVGSLTRFFPEASGPWTANASLPGGMGTARTWRHQAIGLEKHYDFLPPSLVGRLASAYGDRIHDILGQASCEDDLGRHLGGGLYEKEAEYLLTKEFAQSAEDILERRSKLGMIVAQHHRAALAAFTGESPRLTPRLAQG